VSKATDLFAAGRLQPAIEALAEELRDNPGNAQLRTSLFELLCFAGNWDWAEKQLYALSGNERGHRVGTLLYLAAIRAERKRHQMFEKKDFPRDAGNRAGAGTCNGQKFSSLRDTDSRIGDHLEVIAGETYLWIPFAHLASLEIPPPRRARDLLWAPAAIRRGAAFQGANLGEVLLPVLSPFSWRHPRDEVRLGRMTIWETLEDGYERPYGQKMLLVDGEEIPILEIRKLEIRQAQAS
jgi:type VI secretion system protein ImpE